VIPTAAGAARPTAPILLDYDGLQRYDGLHRVVRAGSGGVVHMFRYDSLGRLRSETGPDRHRQPASANTAMGVRVLSTRGLRSSR
jgi:YD repeat-containing protein